MITNDPSPHAEPLIEWIGSGEFSDRTDCQGFLPHPAECCGQSVLRSEPRTDRLIGWCEIRRPATGARIRHISDLRPAELRFSRSLISAIP